MKITPARCPLCAGPWDYLVGVESTKEELAFDDASTDYDAVNVERQYNSEAAIEGSFAEAGCRCCMHELPVLLGEHLPQPPYGHTFTCETLTREGRVFKHGFVDDEGGYSLEVSGHADPSRHNLHVFDGETMSTLVVPVKLVLRAIEVGQFAHKIRVLAEVDRKTAEVIYKSVFGEDLPDG